MNVIDEYLELSIKTATPWQLHLLVIEEALKYASCCHDALKDRDFESANFAAERARGYVSEMLTGLRSDVSPELTMVVKDYFLHIQKNLHLADFKQDTAAAAHAVELLEDYRRTWIELKSRLAH